ncbi:hypothetical protein, partial [Dokdonella sp.]|uniref:hypothetical protein n=1 Tax=Dokdonella sp. TaxID=2291710 RepID=UPI003BAE4322
MHQRRSTHARALDTVALAPGNGAQFGIDDGEQTVGRRAVAALRPPHQFGEFFRHALAPADAVCIVWMLTPVWQASVYRC